MEDYDIEKKLEIYRATCRKGTDWLLGFMNVDGSIGPIDEPERIYYYRVPWAFALMGEISSADRALDWVSRHMFSVDGEVEGHSPRGLFDTLYGSYPLACLLIAAVMRQRFSLVIPGARCLATWQDPESGGFYNNRQDMTETGEQVLFPTAQGGMTLLQLGQIEAARKAGVWFRRLWELQPDIEHRLYAVFSRAKGLVTGADASESAGSWSSDLPEHEFVYVTKKDEPWQAHFNGGIAAAFLTQLHTATGKAEWLDLARGYQEFSMTTNECQFQSMQVCKSGWGSGMLYVATREARYQDWTVRMGDWFVEHQLEDGHWENTKHWTPIPTVSNNIEITAEFVMHLANIISYLSV